jgi:hypothetical protein
MVSSYEMPSPYKMRTSPHTAPTQKWSSSESRKEERCFIRDHFHEGFPSGRSAADAAFNAFYNASWILLKQSTAFLPRSKRPKGEEERVDSDSNLRQVFTSLRVFHKQVIPESRGREDRSYCIPLL